MDSGRAAHAARNRSTSSWWRDANEIGESTPRTWILGKTQFWRARQKNPLGPPREDVSDRVLVTVFTPVEMPEEVANTAATLDNRVVAFLVFMQNPH